MYIEKYLEKEVMPIIEKQKTENRKRYGTSFIPYDVDLSVYPLDESVDGVYQDRIRRIPSDYFITIEFCKPLQSSDRKEYEYSFYSPYYPSYCSAGAFRGLGEENAPHRHDYYELIYVFQGHRMMEVEGQEVTINQGQMLIFDMNLAHIDLRSRSACGAIYLCFTRRAIDRWFLSNLSNPQLRMFFQDRGSYFVGPRFVLSQPELHGENELTECFSQLCRELDTARAGSARVSQVWLLRLLNHLQQEDSIHTYDKKLSGTKLFQAVAQYISENIAAVCVEDLSRKFHYQEDYFNRLIKRNTGLTYSQYVSRIRLSQAKTLLSNSDLTIKEIRESLGYASHSYFYKLFWEETGMRPKEFRQHYQVNKTGEL